MQGWIISSAMRRPIDRVEKVQKIQVRQRTTIPTRPHRTIRRIDKSELLLAGITSINESISYSDGLPQALEALLSSEVQRLGGKRPQEILVCSPNLLPLTRYR